MIPSLSVVQTPPSRRRNEEPALSSPAKPSRPVQQAFDKPFEAHRDFVKAAVQLRADAIDHAAAHYGFPDGKASGPSSSGSQTSSGCRPKGSGSGAASRCPWSRCHGGRGRYRGKRNVEFVFQSDQPLHGVRRRGIHANFAVPIDGHESKRWINGFVHNRQIEPYRSAMRGQ